MLNTQRGKTMYKLDVERDVDPDGSGGYILNLLSGFRFYDEIVHVRGYDTMKELRYAFKNDVIECDCKQCQTELASAKQAG